MDLSMCQHIRIGANNKNGESYLGSSYKPGIATKIIHKNGEPPEISKIGSLKIGSR
jgi:hypothetical protein